MKPSKRKRLEKAGWTVGTVQDFLGLSDAESTYIELKIALAHALRSRREKLKITQTQLAQRIHSSQSRVAKMEAADPGVSLDLLVRALLATGASDRDVGSAIVSGASKRAA